MKLETQIEKLAQIGIHLNEGISVEDFLTSFDRNEYEESPFGLILFVYGIEVEKAPWGRFFCDRAWNFDTECIASNGDYVSIVQNFHRITGRAKNLSDVSDQIDIEGGKACLQYKVDGEQRFYDIKVDDDWADPETVSSIMEDLKVEGFEFYPKDNGQASIWFYLTPNEAKQLNAIAGNVFNLESKPWWKIW